MARTYFIETYGCEMNKSDSIDIALSFQAHGFEESTCEGEADVIVLNTCSVREHAEERIFGRLGYYRSLRGRRHKDALIVLAGCMAQEQGERIIEHFPEIKVVTGPYHYLHLPDAVYEYEETRRPVILIDKEQYVFSSFKGARAEGYKAWVNIIMGCSNYCSYCIVPYLRGPEKSKPSAEVIDEVDQLAERGVVEVTLLGQNVNAYGRDSGDRGFVDLVEKINDIDGIRWIRFITSHPRDFKDQIVSRLASLEKVCSHIHLPLQSGSDRILSLMNRQYDLNHYRSVVDAIRTYFSDVAITTDIIVGFPTETDDDFRMTLDVVEEIEFDDAFTYRYSARPFTDALKLENHTATDSARDRLKDLIGLQRSISRRKNEEEIGKRVTALVERESKRNAAEMLCKTEKNKMVVVPTDQCPGQFIEVEIEGIAGNTLRGRAVQSD